MPVVISLHMGKYIFFQPKVNHVLLTVWQLVSTSILREQVKS